MTEPSVVDAIATPSVRADAIDILFEYLARTEVEVGRPRPHDVGELPLPLRHECLDLVGSYGESGCFLVAYANTHPVGCVGGRAMSQSPSVLEVKRLYVRDAYRGRGVARLLLRRVHDHAGGVGAGRVVLDVLPDRLAAITLYRSLGYREGPHPQPDNPYGMVWFERQL